MNTLSYKTVSAKKESVERKWILVDAEGQPLGRLASRIASVLRGKTNVNYTPHVDCGDNVVVINAEKVTLTGRKMSNRIYLRHTGFPGGQRESTPKEILEKHPNRLIEMSVRGMLPKNKLGRAMIKKMFVYAGPTHPHQAQKPELTDLLKK